MLAMAHASTMQTGMGFVMRMRSEVAWRVLHVTTVQGQRMRMVLAFLQTQVTTAKAVACPTTMETKYVMSLRLRDVWISWLATMILQRPMRTIHANIAAPMVVAMTKTVHVILAAAQRYL
jgi:hypothetical protein